MVRLPQRHTTLAMACDRPNAARTLTCGDNAGVSEQSSRNLGCGDVSVGAACVVLADSVPLGRRAPFSPSLPPVLGAVALAVSHELLSRGRWVSRVRVADDQTAREMVGLLRADGHAAVLGPPDEAQAVGWFNRNRPVSVGEQLAVCFPWAEADVPMVIEIDPGGAFGAGTHPSTRLLAEWLVRQVAGGERVLDVGCGSGVLALVAPGWAPPTWRGSTSSQKPWRRPRSMPVATGWTKRPRSAQRRSARPS